MITSRQLKNPSYLLHTRYGYYFRLRVPSDLVTILGCKQIKISVMTGRAKTARRRAVKLAACALDLFRLVRQGKQMEIEDIKKVLRQQIRDALKINSVIEATNTTPVDVDVYIGYLVLEMDRFRRQLDENDFSEVREAVLDLIQRDGMEIREDSVNFKIMCREYLKHDIIWYEILVKRALHDYTYEESIFPPKIQSISTIEGNADMTASTKPSKLISEAVPEFKSEKDKEGCSFDYLSDIELTFNTLFIKINGDMRLRSVETSHIREVIRVIWNLPPNWSKMKIYKDKNPKDISDGNQGDSLSHNRVRKYFDVLSAFFGWCEVQGHIDKNPVKEGMVPKPDDEDGEPFSIADLRSIFYANEYKDDLFDNAFQFWLPLLALFTGARLNELTPLKPVDVKNENGIWVIYIEGKVKRKRRIAHVDPGITKKVKTKQSIRKVPLHPFLLDIGFHRYAQEQFSNDKQIILFDLLEYKWKNKKLGQKMTNEFTKFRRRLGIEDGKNFHSFRHSLIDNLRNHGVSDEQIGYIVGHKDQKSMTGLYGGDVWLTTLSDWISRAKFDVDLSHLLKSKFARPV